MKRELSQKTKLLICQSIYVPTLTYGHELWVVIERMRCQLQAAIMSFHRRVTGLSLRDRMRSCDIWEELRVEPLLLPIERSQLRWFQHAHSGEETLGKTKDRLERLYVLLSPRRNRWKWMGRGTSGSPSSDFSPCDLDLDKKTN